MAIGTRTSRGRGNFSLLTHLSRYRRQASRGTMLARTGRSDHQFAARQIRDQFGLRRCAGRRARRPVYLRAAKAPQLVVSEFPSDDPRPLLPAFRSGLSNVTWTTVNQEQKGGPIPAHNPTLEITKYQHRSHQEEGMHKRWLSAIVVLVLA